MPPLNSTSEIHGPTIRSYSVSRTPKSAPRDPRLAGQLWLPGIRDDAATCAEGVVACTAAEELPIEAGSIDVFPADHQHQIRTQLADNLLLSFNQRLVKMRSGKGRIPAYEKLSNSYRVANLIREGKYHQIRSHLVASEEFNSLDTNLAYLVNQRQVNRDTALHFSQDQKTFTDLLD